MGMIGVALLLAQAVTAPTIYPVDMTDAEFCATANELAAGMMREVPKQVDSTTRLEGMVVFCSLKNLTWKKTISATPSEFRDGWEARKRVEWERGACSNPLFARMATKGWSYTQDLTMRDGQSLRFVAYCK